MEAAGIIALVRATTATTLHARQLCMTWKDAPRDVFFLRDQLDTCQTFFVSIQTAIVESSALSDLPLGQEFVEAQREQLGLLLERGASITHSLGCILVELIGNQAGNAGTRGGTSSQARLGLRKRMLWLRRMDDVSNLRKMLSRTTDNIALCLIMLNVQITLMAAQGTSNRALLQQAEASIITGVTDALESSKEELGMPLEQTMRSRITRQLEEAQPGMSSSLENGLSSVYRGGLQHEANPNHPIHESTIRHDSGIKSAFPGPALSPNSLGIGAGADWEPVYSCTCHAAITRYNSRWEFSFLEPLLGALKVSYSSPTHNPPVLCRSPRCKEHNTAQQYTRAVIQYGLPSWLGTSIISLYFLRHIHPELLIRIHRLIDPKLYSQSILGKVITKDIRAVRGLLISCPSSVHDMLGETQNSALMYAVNSQNASMVQLLLQAGADPFQQNTMKTSPAQHALLCSLQQSNSTRDSAAQRIAEVMPIARLYQEDDYSDLHRIITGVLPLDLGVALMSPTFRNQVNSRTANGITPLHLAARICPGDREVRLLLEAGANPNSMFGGDGSTPLIWACKGAGNGSSVRALISAGASRSLGTTNRGTLEMTPLHDAMRVKREYANLTGLVDILLDNEHGLGLDMDAVDYHGCTALIKAVMYDNIDGVRLLIARGADINVMDEDGDTALHIAIEVGSHGSVRPLLGISSSIDEPTRNRQGVMMVHERYRMINGSRGWSILHHLANHGDKEMMELFASIKMTGLPDPEDFGDCYGQTAVDVFRRRVDLYSGSGEDEETGKLVKAWGALLASVNQNIDAAATAHNLYGTGGLEGNQSTGGWVGDSDDDEFFDAVELPSAAALSWK
ncbi:ankyrin repeat-containing domain protein [Rhypophila decipiens]|uniref:Ankyrin repeat-containing domain protein n=1 Tax=Rhypophila decipiens TaxID=261697 RepID=A0AAN7BAP3_9PEZI|nr:ankyrin repeat-containing domain protein [Rhypophila decipiens]